MSKINVTAQKGSPANHAARGSTSAAAAAPPSCAKEAEIGLPLPPSRMKGVAPQSRGLVLVQTSEQSQINNLFEKELKIVNFGIRSFNEDLVKQGKQSIHVDWKPVGGGDKKIAGILKKISNPTLSEKINEANALVLARILKAQPTLVGLSVAKDVIPNMTTTTVLHSGPPVTWESMCPPQKGAVIGGLLYENLAKTPEEAEKLAESGAITFSPCHHHGAVGPMAGIVTPSMPVWIVQNKTEGNYAYCTINEGLGKVLRFGAYQPDVIDRLRWIESELYPLLKEALTIHGELDLKTMIAQALQMGDEGHNRNKAGTSLLIRAIAPAIVQTGFSSEQKIKALRFLDSNDHTFLNLTMPAMKSTLDPVCDVPYSTIVYTMARNGTEFGIRISGLGNRWFTAPAEVIDGLYFPGYTMADANPDVGDSCITETAGIGGFCMGAAPAIVQFVGGTPADAINYSKSMFEITEGEGETYKIPVLDFRGSATGIDMRKVIETNILPVINTGIAANKAGIGQVGAGIVFPPMACFTQALEAFSEKYV